MLGSKVTAGAIPMVERGQGTFFIAKLKSSYPNLIVFSESVSGKVSREESLLIPLPPLGSAPWEGSV